MIIDSIKIPFWFSENFSIVNLSTKIHQFQSRNYDYYPHLPIHIFTQNLSLISNISTSKIILLGNGFFGNAYWHFALPNRSSSEKMNALFCPFLANRCDITADLNRFSEADAIVYHIRDQIDRQHALTNRYPRQRFVFATWEAPADTDDLKNYDRFFNWSMTFRFDSHIVAAYYSGNAYIHTSSDYYQLMLRENMKRNLNLKTRALNHRPSDKVLKMKKLGTAAALISNCRGSKQRLEFIKKLSQHIDVKIYGQCGQSCPADINCRQFIAQNYYFILSFENNFCLHYTSEKFFMSLEYPVVPVVLGRTNYSYFIPSTGYIDVYQFSTMSSLAKYLNETRCDKEKYLSYFAWKKDYIWGFGDFFTPFCDLCLRLHFDSQPNIIDDIKKWWFDDTCQKIEILP